MPREPHWTAAVPLLVALASAACGEPVGSGEAPVDCAAAPDFTPCEAEGGATAMCLEGACLALSPCLGAGCATGPTFPLADSSLTECQGPDGPVPCSDTGGSATCANTPLCGQDAQYGWDASNDRADRFVAEGATGERVVVDGVTGLVWQGCAMGQGSACAGEAVRGSWHDAVAFCEDSAWGGHDDWVLPDAWAVQSTVDYGTTSPAIDTGAFPNAPSRFDEDGDEWWIECTWTSTDSANDPNVAWAVLVNSGDVLSGSGVPFHSHDKDAAGWVGCYTRCVRAHEPPGHQRFVAVGDVSEPIVVDTITRRSWQGCSVGQSGVGCGGDASTLTWADALSACEALDWGGHDDWRLPNVVELRSIVDLTAFRPAIDGVRFPNTPYYDGTDDRRGQYWTSTARWYNAFALYVSFHDGGSHFYVQDELRHARCVRGG